MAQFEDASITAVDATDALFASLAHVDKRMRRIARAWAVRRVIKATWCAFGRGLVVSGAACGGRAVTMRARPMSS